jgi:hypothetical protein
MTLAESDSCSFMDFQDASECAAVSLAQPAKRLGEENILETIIPEIWFQLSVTIIEPTLAYASARAKAYKILEGQSSA